jgi:Na+/proline symporter
MPYAVIIFTALGFAWYISIANRNKASTIEQFFLGGRNISGSLFQNATWGTSFAFNNGIYWGISFGYLVGLNALWINGSWAAGFIGLSLLLPRLVGPTERFTLHGFLGERFGPKARIMASVASSTVMIFNIGAEIFFASIFISYFLGSSLLEVVVAIVIATFSASFCSVGGYRANAAIDTYQNPLSVFALTLIICLCATHASIAHPSSLLILSLCSAGFLLIFVIFAVATPNRYYRYEAICLSAVVAAAAGIVWATFTGGTIEPSVDVKPLLLSFGPYTGWYIASVVVFQFAYQFVDTSNWQNISARRISLLPPDSHGKSVDESHEEEAISIKRMVTGLRLAAFRIFLAPIFLATLAGIMFRVISPENKSADAYFMIDLINTVTGALPLWARYLIVGALSFILIGSSRSGIDSWVMAASQTLSWDILDHKALKEREFKVDNLKGETEQRLVAKSKNMLYILTLAGAIAYYVLYKLAEGKIVAVFGVIFSSSLALLPSLFYALFTRGEATQAIRITSFVSMATGYAIPLLLFGYLSVFDSVTAWSWVISKDDTFTLAPFLALGISLLCLVAGVLIAAGNKLVFKED